MENEKLSKLDFSYSAILVCLILFLISKNYSNNRTHEKLMRNVSEKLFSRTTLRGFLWKLYMLVLFPVG